MKKTAAIASFALALTALVPAAFADEATTMVGGGASAAFDWAAFAQAGPGGLDVGASGDALGGADAMVVPFSSASDSAMTMDVQGIAPAELRAAPAFADAWSLDASHGARPERATPSASELQDGEPTFSTAQYGVSTCSGGDSAFASSFGGWSVSSSRF